MTWIESSNGCSRPFVFVRTGGRIDRDSGTGDMRLRGGCCAGGGDKHRLLFGDPSISIGSSRSIVVSKSSEKKSELGTGDSALAEISAAKCLLWSKATALYLGGF